VGCFVFADIRSVLRVYCGIIIPMSKIKSPQDKKRNSLLKDRRNTYGECPTSSRKSIRKGKQRTQQALRRAVAKKLAAAIGPTVDADVESIQIQVRYSVTKLSKSLFKKVPEEPLAVVLRRKLDRRATKIAEPKQPVSWEMNLREEDRMLRKLRKHAL